MRIDYHDSIAVDYLPFHLYQPVTVTPRPMQLVSASHNAAGDVTAMIANDRGPEVVVKRGESLDLVFQGSPPPAGYKQMVLFASQGRYEKTSDFDARSHGIAFDQNYPNPFNPNTSFRYFLPEARKVTLEVYNVLGQKVVVLTDGLQTAGEHVVNWDSRDGHGDAVASGIYFARFTAGDFTATKKLEVLK
ncbi:MAG: T9SS type A sorting domain-containing protein [candidate division Zixibacteria bacterium]|nr:T9SS type A sorting domain-containing protein [candidate division Zixibacteria bacterium]